jgi:Uma2 family endonuclease
MITERLYTAADLWELSHMPDYADNHLELSRGELIVMAPAGGLHGGIVMNFGSEVHVFVSEHDLGYVTGAETGYILFKAPDARDVVRAPDVGFISKARLPAGLPEGYIPLAPDLAVEVVSPNDRASDIQEKVADYLRYGVRLVVVVYPKTKNVVVETAQGARTLTVDDTFDGGEVLPGFALPVRDLFPAG